VIGAWAPGKVRRQSERRAPRTHSLACTPSFLKKEISAGVPLARFGKRDEIALAVAFLAAEDSS